MDQLAAVILSNLIQLLKGCIVLRIDIGIIKHLLICGVSWTHIAKPCLASLLILFTRFQILTRQNTSSQRAPSNQAKSILSEQRFILNLDIRSYEHIVVVLGSYRFMKVQILANT